MSIDTVCGFFSNPPTQKIHSAPRQLGGLKSPLSWRAGARAGEMVALETLRCFLETPKIHQKTPGGCWYMFFLIQFSLGFCVFFPVFFGFLCVFFSGFLWVFVCVYFSGFLWVFVFFFPVFFGILLLLETLLVLQPRHLPSFASFVPLVHHPRSSSVAREKTRWSLVERKGFVSPRHRNTPPTGYASKWVPQCCTLAAKEKRRKTVVPSIQNQKNVSKLPENQFKTLFSE